MKYSLLDNKNKNGIAVTNGCLENENDPSKMMQKMSLIDEEKDSVVTNKLAVTSLLHRFQEVLCKYIEDEKLSSPVPLASHRVTELSFVLKALTTLISSLKSGQGEVDVRTWQQIIALYPHLVGATSIQSSTVTSSLQLVLHQYSDLLQPPIANCQKD